MKESLRPKISIVIKHKKTKSVIKLHLTNANHLQPLFLESKKYLEEKKNNKEPKNYIKRANAIQINVFKLKDTLNKRKKQVEKKANANDLTIMELEDVLNSTLKSIRNSKTDKRNKQYFPFLTFTPEPNKDINDNTQLIRKLSSYKRKCNNYYSNDIFYLYKRQTNTPIAKKHDKPKLTIEPTLTITNQATLQTRQNFYKAIIRIPKVNALLYN